MADSVLVLTTQLGIRPLGVRGEPLHAAQHQIRSAIARRLGPTHAALLAIPQLHDDGLAIDWYGEARGEVRPLHALAAAERTAVLATVDRLEAEIGSLGRELADGSTSEQQLLGRALQLAARRPSDDFVFVIGDQPVIVAWGYEGGGLPPPFLPAIPASTGPAPAVLAAGAPALAMATAPLWQRWLGAALLGLLLVLALLAASWLLRQCAPVEPEVAVTRLPPEPVPPPPPPPPDPTPEKRATLASLQDHEKALQGEIVGLERSLADRLAQCKPPEPPKVAVAPPPPPPPKPVKPPEPPKPVDLPEDRWKRGDVSLLEGCWTLGRDSFTTMSTVRGTVRGTNKAGRMCFDKAGNGTREARAEFQGQPTVTCRAPIRVRFEGDGSMHTTQPQVTCNPRTVTWHSEPNYLTCRRVSDTVALCRDRQGYEHEFRREAGRR